MKKDWQQKSLHTKMGISSRKDIKERKDELLILDIDMPGKSGLDILKEFEIH